MKLPIWQVDAFAARRFAGNPAAVVVLPAWLPDETLLAIAAENNLSETAFLVRRDDGSYAIRWFTPLTEMPLCGHATLASGWVVLNALERERDRVAFSSQSGVLAVQRDGARLVLDFPSIPPGAGRAHPELVRALGAEPRELYSGFQWLAVYDDEHAVRNIAPDFAALGELDVHGVIVSAPGRDCDFVSRFFAPSAGIDEDPVTGAAHSRLTPYWAQRLGKTRLHARQVSARGGELWCELRGERVAIAGEVVPYLAGQIEVQ